MEKKSTVKIFSKEYTGLFSDIPQAVKTDIDLKKDALKKTETYKK